MNRYFLVPLLGIVATVTLQTQSVFAFERSEISAKIKEFTVQIDGEATGTGTIIEQNGDTYTVITCWHVVQSLGSYQVIAPDGEKYRATDIKNLTDVDLATIKFTSSKVYSVAQLGDSQAIAEGINTHVVGYPDPIPGIPDRIYTFLNSGIVAKLTNAENGYQIIHDNPSTPGGSGGGIFDVNNRLIAVNGQSISDGNTGKVYGKGIPIEIYLATRSDLKIPVATAGKLDLVTLGMQKYKQKDYQGAIALFNRALATDVNNIDAYFRRGSAFLALQDYAAAIADFSRFLQLSPNNHLAYFYRGYIRAEREDYQNALADYNRAIQLDFNFDPAYINRGVARAKLGDIQNALADYDRAIQLNPEAATAYYNRGLVYGRDLGDYQKALVDFSQAIELTPEDAEVYVDRGNVYTLLKKTRSAIDDYTQAISINPQHAQAHYNRGIAYSQENEPEKALADLQRAATLFQARGDDANYQRALDLVREIQGI
jgi:tetratricopeptide (TPR) repeat protein